jgi:peptide/nickel transport system ATP-binding protein
MNSGVKPVRQLTTLRGTAALYVSHDLAVVATLATRVAVMYAGRIVELGPNPDIFRSAAHPYTRRLIAAIPHLSDRRELIGIPGRAPSPGRRPPGCAFQPRCTMAVPACSAEPPEMRMVDNEHFVRCLRAAEVLTQPSEYANAANALHAPRNQMSVLALESVGAAYGGSKWCTM